MMTGPRNSELARAQKQARDQLYRHGFHRKRRCTVLDHAKLILVRDPAEPRQTLFASLVYNDLMHWELNVCDYGFTAIVGVMTNEMKIECDRNTRALPMFRNPDGSGLRRFTHSSISPQAVGLRLCLYGYTHSVPVLLCYQKNVADRHSVL